MMGRSRFKSWSVTGLLGQDVFGKRSTPKHAASTSKDVSFERQEPGPSVHKIHFGQDVNSISSKTHPGCQLLLPLVLRHIQAANFFSLLRSDTSRLPTSSPSCAQTHPGCQLLLPLVLRHIWAANFSLLRSDTSGLPISPSCVQTHLGYQPPILTPRSESSWWPSYTNLPEGGQGRKLRAADYASFKNLRDPFFTLLSLDPISPSVA
uniref:Uncharacterized protein n=1 Tax=Timema genevievae TaxID=629358 RepID=A0A7R9PH81_TIMGE|nr:unnamed protein product [Timema genevievae]